MLDLTLLKELTAAPGVSGQEEAVRKIVREEFTHLLPEVREDSMGNLVGHRAGLGPRLLLDAHMDEVGLLVQHIDEQGFLRLIPVGSIDPRVLYGQSVLVWGREPLVGVIGAVPPHLLAPEAAEKDRVIPVEDLFVDLGLPPEEVHVRVRLGDAVTFFGLWDANDWSVKARALDDRVGLFVMIEALKRVRTPACDLFVVASVQEEVGLRGAGPVAERVRPDLVLALEGTVANDLPGVPPHRALARLGDGPELRLSDARFLAHRGWTNFLVRVAREADIAHQIVAKRVGGTNAAALQVGAEGARAAALSVPVRYIHGPVSVLQKSDLEAAVALVAEVLTSVAHFELVG